MASRQSPSGHRPTGLNLLDTLCQMDGTLQTMPTQWSRSYRKEILRSLNVAPILSAKLSRSFRTASTTGRHLDFHTTQLTGMSLLGGYIFKCCHRSMCTAGSMAWPSEPYTLESGEAAEDRWASRSLRETQTNAGQKSTDLLFRFLEVRHLRPTVPMDGQVVQL